MPLIAHQAIITQTLPHTRTRLRRVKATAGAGSVTLDLNDDLTLVENCAAAAKALADKFGWGGSWVVGGVPQSTKFAYVFVNAEAHAFKGETVDQG